MDVIDTRRWNRASRLLDQALDLPHHQLDTWLGELRASDADAAADVEALLLEHRQLNDEGFLDGGMPSIDVPAGRRHPRRLHARLADRPGRDGQRLARRAQRRPLPGPRRGQAAERVAARAGRGGPLPPRRNGPRQADPPPHRPADRRRRLAGRSALPGARVRRRPAHRPLLRRPAARRRGSHPPVPGRPGGGRARPRQPDRPSRPEAVERARDRPTARSSCSTSASPSCSATTKRCRC